MQIYVNNTIITKQKGHKKRKYTKVSANLWMILLWMIFSPLQVY